MNKMDNIHYNSPYQQRRHEPRKLCNMAFDDMGFLDNICSIINIVVQHRRQ